MARKTSTNSADVSRQTLMTSIVIALMVGFFGGIVFSAYKMDSGVPAGTSSGMPQDDQRARMMQALTERVRQNPQDVDSWIQLGHLYFDNNAFSEAIAAYEKALALAPNNAPVRTDLGVMYRRAKRPEDAIREFDRAIAIDPQLEQPRFNKGIVLLHDLGDREGAVKAWEGLLEINPLAKAPNGQTVDELVMQNRGDGK